MNESIYESRVVQAYQVSVQGPGEVPRLQVAGISMYQQARSLESR